MRFLILLLLLVSCIPSPEGSKGVVNLGEKAKQGIGGSIQGPIRPTLSNVLIQNGNLVVEGTNLDKVLYLQINGKGDGQNFFFDIVSKTASKIIAQARQSTSLLAETFLNLVLHEANGSTSYPVTVTIPDGSITAEKLDDMNAQNGQVLKYNMSLGKWEATDLDGLNYKGAWNVNTMTPDLESLSTIKKGDYYVVNIGGSSDLLNPGAPEDWNPGDWAVYNGSFWERINNSGSVTDVNGISGPSIQLKMEDLHDVDVTGLNDGQTLVWENANSRWKPANVLTNSGNTIGESDLQDSSVTNSKISDNSISLTKIQDNSINSAKILNNTILNEDINSNAKIDVTKIGNGSIDGNEFNHLQNIGGNIQLQLDSRLKLDGTSAMTGDLNLGGNGISNIKNVGLFNLLDNSLGPIGTSSGEAGQIRFKELSPGSNYVGLKAPDNIAANLLFTLPTSVGNPGDVLQTDGVSGRMSWDKVSLSNLAAGTPEHVLIMNAVGGVTTEAQLKVLRGGTNKSSYEDGSVPYYDSTTSSLNESSALKFDDTNLRLGIGTASDTINAKLHVKTDVRATIFDATDSTTWADQIIENPTSVTDSATGLLFRVDDNNNGYAGI
ncbi:MAG: hypothetical protein OEY33_06990, partial [Bdellovibrionales bacterium]|nr:hypothetical protein [Bdellovibrionales bacterium]